MVSSTSWPQLPQAEDDHFTEFIYIDCCVVWVSLGLSLLDPPAECNQRPLRLLQPGKPFALTLAHPHTHTHTSNALSQICVEAVPAPQNTNQQRLQVG